MNNALLIDVEELAKTLNISKKHVLRLRTAGKIPQPIKLGKSCRWSIKEIEAWIIADCPPLSKWLPIKESLFKAILESSPSLN